MGRGKLYDMMEKEGRLVGRRQEQDDEKLKEESRKNGESEQRKKVCVKYFHARRHGLLLRI
jgi:hypothetical protein